MAQQLTRGEMAVGSLKRRPGWSAFPVSWLFLLPTLVFFVGWQLYPIARVAWLSFTDYHFLRTTAEVNWVGLQNYRTAFSDPLVRQGLLRAAGFTALFLPGMIFIPMVLAVLVDRYTGRTATFLRLVLLIPSMIPGPLIFVLWKWLYDGYIGPINYVLVDVLGIYTIRDQPRWLADPQLVFISIAVMAWWWGLGYHAMFYLAGLASIPRDLYDAARVDGANEWRLFWDVTFQRLRPMILVLVVLRFGTAMAAIDEYLILGGGGERDRPTYTWTVYMWDLGFRLGDRNQGYAAAVGWIGTIAMLAVVLGLFRLFRSRD